MAIVDISCERKCGKSNIEDLPSGAQLKPFSYRLLSIMIIYKQSQQGEMRK
jgi:hypothetical protein